LSELEKIVKEKKLKVPKRKVKLPQRDGKDRIQKKILDGNPAYDEKDGIYYWKGTNIKVDISQVQ
jgi:hypothetical protein